MAKRRLIYTAIKRHFNNNSFSRVLLKFHVGFLHWSRRKSDSPLLELNNLFDALITETTPRFFTHNLMFFASASLKPVDLVRQDFFSDSSEFLGLYLVYM